VGSLILGAVFLGERPSPLQFAGVFVMLCGVLIAASGTGQGSQPPAEPVASPLKQDAERPAPLPPAIG
jgi:drug/metabolite transporter (DMT)-like permease